MPRSTRSIRADEVDKIDEIDKVDEINVVDEVVEVDKVGNYHGEDVVNKVDEDDKGNDGYFTDEVTGVNEFDGFRLRGSRCRRLDDEDPRGRRGGQGIQTRSTRLMWSTRSTSLTRPKGSTRSTR